MYLCATNDESTLEEVRRLILEWDTDHDGMLDQLVPQIYDELRLIARSQLRKERNNHTLRTDALVNEAYLKLSSQKAIRIKDRAHFFGIASRVMRQVLVDYAREHLTEKRGGQFDRIFIESMDNLPGSESVDLVVLDEALDSLNQFSPRHCRIIEMRYFGGLTIEQTASLLQVSQATVKREWSFAKSWLQRKILGRPNAQNR